jgi:hypothetical protein
MLLVLDLKKPQGLIARYYTVFLSLGQPHGGTLDALQNRQILGRALFFSQEQPKLYRRHRMVRATWIHAVFLTVLTLFEPQRTVSAGPVLTYIPPNNAIGWVRVRDGEWQKRPLSLDPRLTFIYERVAGVPTYTILTSCPPPSWGGDRYTTTRTTQWQEGDAHMVVIGCLEAPSYTEVESKLVRLFRDLPNEAR